MATEVRIPDIGDFEGVEVIEVLVSEGDAVAKEDSLITLESDKAAMDVPAPAAGEVLAVKVKNGDKVSEGDVIMSVEEAEGEPAEPAKAGSEGSPENADEREQTPPASESESKETPPASGVESGEAPAPSGTERATPAAQASESAAGGSAPIERASQVLAHAGPSVRKLARGLGVDLSQVRGSGYKERITHNDVRRYVKSALRGGTAGGGLPPVPEVDYARFGALKTRPLSRIKRLSGPRLQAAWVNAPHVTQHDEADMTTLESVRKAMNAGAGEGYAKVTLLAFLVRASVLALKAYPAANSALDGAGENLLERQYFHIGFAVDTEQGLVVPVIRDADKKGVREIAAELAALAEKARAGRLKLNEIEGACFSITSLGSIGGTAFTPIVNAPEVAILGVSRAEMKPKWNGHDFEPRRMLPLSLSYDHRVVDGALAVRFTRHLAETVETLRGLVG